MRDPVFLRLWACSRVDGDEESLAPICKDNEVSELDMSNGRAVWYMSLSHESCRQKNNQKTRYWKRTAERESKEEKSTDEGTVKNQEGS